MKMLRQWNGESNDIILTVLKQFGIKADAIRLQKYEAISPDSFIWCFAIPREDESEYYYLYAEDYVPSLEHVRDQIDQNSAEWIAEEKNLFEFVPVLEPADWKSAEPVKTAAVYAEPENTDELMKYALPSGYDFVFLAKAKA